MIPTPDWEEDCILLLNGEERRHGPLRDLVLAASTIDLDERPEFVIVSDALGELDNEQIEGLRRRPDFPDLL